MKPTGKTQIEKFGATGGPKVADGLSRANMCSVLLGLSALQPTAPSTQHLWISAIGCEYQVLGGCSFISCAATLVHMFLTASGQDGFLYVDCETPCIPHKLQNLKVGRGSCLQTSKKTIFWGLSTSVSQWLGQKVGTSFLSCPFRMTLCPFGTVLGCFPLLGQRTGPKST